MMDLDHIQRSMFDAVRQPLTDSEGMRQRSSDGRSMNRIAEEIINRLPTGPPRRNFRVIPAALSESG
jgi:hypothetical protein